MPVFYIDGHFLFSVITVSVALAEAMSEDLLLSADESI
jgi:hypothetical protein